MCLGIGIGLAGLALVLSSWLNLVFPAVFVLLMDRFYIPREEQVLEANFGQEYRNYQQRVRRWL